MTHRVLGATLLALGALVCVSCGSSGSDTGGGGASFDCNSGCDKIIAFGCPNDTKTDCVQSCQDDLAQAGSCTSQTNSLYACFLGQPLQCSASGKATVDPAVAGNQCVSQSIAAARCGACTVDSGDSACDACEKQSCCSETQAIYDDASFMAYFKCYTACQDSTCKQACTQQYPSITQKGAAVAACNTSKCASACATP